MRFWAQRLHMDHYYRLGIFIDWRNYERGVTIDIMWWWGGVMLHIGLKD